MQKRNEDANNGLLQLGGGIDEPQRGKGVVTNSRAAQCAKPQDYFPVTKNKPLPTPSYREEFQNYKQEDIKRSNDLDEKTLRREAVQFMKDDSPKTKGHIRNTLLSMSKADRKFVVFLTSYSEFSKAHY